MRRTFTYSNSFLSKNIKIKYKYSDLILLQRGIFSRDTKFYIGNQEYLIKESGLFSKHSYVYDSYNNLVAHIRFSIFNRYAQIIYREDDFFWRLDNFFGSRWTLHNNYRKMMCRESFSGGFISSDLDDDILTSLGVYMGKKYYDMSNIFLMIIIIFLFLL